MTFVCPGVSDGHTHDGCTGAYKTFFTDCKIMKNRKFLGSLPEQSVRQKSKPFIIEMDKDK